MSNSTLRLPARDDLAVTVVKGRNAGRTGVLRVVYGKATCEVRFPDGTIHPILLSSLDPRSRAQAAAVREGVTLEWLEETLTAAEALAWLGL